MQPAVRAYQPADFDAVYDICVRTADTGGDARGVYTSDRLVGDIFAGPYVTHDPQHAYLLDDGTGQAVGYILGTPDTSAFVRWYRAEWLPAHPYPEPHDPRDTELIGLHERPEHMLVPELADYPAHLHIDLLPEWQGKGWGRELMTVFLAGLAEVGVPRVHLGVSPRNVGARAFYARLGFTAIAVPNTSMYLGRETGYSPRR